MNRSPPGSNPKASTSRGGPSPSTARICASRPRTNAATGTKSSRVSGGHPMKITYTGRHEDIPGKLRQKFETKLSKLSKMLERSRNGERELHVILSQQRHLHKVEITLNAFDHSLV